MSKLVQSPKRILVAGATGNQGGGVVKALAALNSLLPAHSPNAFTILAITRSPSSPKAQALLSLRGVELIEGNLEDSPSIFRAALAGGPVHGVYSVQQGQGEGGEVDIERKQAMSLAKAAKECGTVELFVFGSVDFGGLEDTRISFFEIKREMEDYIKELGLPYTMVRNTGLMDSFLNEDTEYTKTYATIMTRLTYTDPERQTEQLIACEDLGKVVAHVFAHPEEYIGKTISLAGDEVTMADFVSTFKRVTGRDMPTISLELARERKSEAFARMSEFLDQHGFTADIAALQKTLPFKLQTWEEFVEKNFVKST